MSTTLNAVLDLHVHHKILNLALTGLTKAEIAEKLNLTEDSVLLHLSQIRGDLTLRMQEAQEQWMAISLARMDKIISKLLPIVMETPQPNLLDTSDEGMGRVKAYANLIGSVSKSYLEIAKMQQSLLQLQQASSKGDVLKVVQNNTFITDSDFYKEAYEAISVDTVDASWEDADQYVDVLPVLHEDPAIAKIEAKIDRLLEHEEEESEV